MRNSRKFSPTIVSRYSVIYIAICICTFYTNHDNTMSATIAMIYSTITLQLLWVLLWSTVMGLILQVREHKLAKKKQLKFERYTMYSRMSDNLHTPYVVA